MTTTSLDKVLYARERVLFASHSAKSAHAGSALSCIELVYTCLKQKKDGELDKVILSKGHAAMALYACAESLGLLDPKHLNQYLQDNTSLWGHPSMNKDFSFIDWSTGSLGHGLSVGTGFALARKKYFKNNKRVVVIMSDGECNEGSIWEALQFAGHHELNNLTLIVDYNKIQSFGTIEEVIKLEPLADKFRAFNWHTEEIDGHNLEEITMKIKQMHPKKPTCLIAHTTKGKGVSEIENTLKSHYSPITEDQLKNYRHSNGIKK